MPEPVQGPHQRRRTFGPVVALGLASAALAAWAGSRPWLSVTAGEPVDAVRRTGVADLTSSPLSTALAFVVLACWGVLLVTRGRFRWSVALLGVAAALGNVVTVAVSPSGLRDRLRDEVRLETGVAPVDLSYTGWFWLAAVAGLLVLGSTVLALRHVRAWPEMGARYDSPSSTRGATIEQPTDNRDIWKALDEGRDPTA